MADIVRAYSSYKKKKVATTQQMAVSLRDAWDEDSLEETSPAAVSAKPSHASPPLPQEEAIQAAKSAEEVGQLRDALVAELQHLRSEQSRRCTVILLVCGVLFAMLFMYIDKLQQQLKVNNAILVRVMSPSPPRRSAERGAGLASWLNAA